MDICGTAGQHKHFCFMCRVAYEDSGNCTVDKDHVWGLCESCEKKSLIVKDGHSSQEKAI